MTFYIRFLIKLCQNISEMGGKDEELSLENLNHICTLGKVYDSFNFHLIVNV